MIGWVAVCGIVTWNIGKSRCEVIFREQKQTPTGLVRTIENEITIDKLIFKKTNKKDMASTKEMEK